MRCMAVAFRPPYSSGQCTAAQRPSLSTRCQAARRCWDFSPESEESSASSSLARNGGRCSSSQAAQFVSERFVFGGQCEVHGSGG